MSWVQRFIVHKNKLHEKTPGTTAPVSTRAYTRTGGSTPAPPTHGGHAAELPRAEFREGLCPPRAGERVSLVPCTQRRDLSPRKLGLNEHAVLQRWEGAAGTPLLPAGVVEGFEGPEVPPRWGKAILQEPPAALAWGLEQLYVTS